MMKRAFEKTMATQLYSRLLTALALGGGNAGCSDDAGRAIWKARTERTNGVTHLSLATACRAGASMVAGAFMAVAGCGDAEGESGSLGRAESAFVVATTVTTADNANTYVTAHPGVPEGRLDTGSALEFAGWASVRIWKQYVFVYDSESAKMRRYVVSKDYTLVQDGPELSFQIAGANAQMDINMYDDGIAYAAPYSPGEVSIVEWNPTMMEVVRIIEADLPGPTVPSFLDSNSFVGRFDGAETWHVYGNDGATLTFNDLIMLGFVEPGSDRMTVIERTGCAPNIKGYVLHGDLYVVGGGTNAELYGNYNTDYADRAPNCILRVKAGTREFDPNYFLNLTEITGSPAIQNTKYFDDDHLIVEYWDPAEPFPENPDDYWTAASFKSLELDLQTGETAAVDDLFPKGTQGSYADLLVDGTPYFATVAGDQSETVVHVVDGKERREVFSTPGYLRIIEFVRE